MLRAVVEKFLLSSDCSGDDCNASPFGPLGPFDAVSFVQAWCEIRKISWRLALVLLGVKNNSENKFTLLEFPTGGG